MKEKAPKVYIVSSIIIAMIFIWFGISASRCSGETCDVLENETEKYNIFNKMNPEIISEKVKNKEIVLLDVREKSEWDEGHIEGAVHIALGDIKAETISVLPKDIPIYVYCRSGSRAVEGESKLRLLGFENVENIGGTIHWEERGGVLVK